MKRLWLSAATLGLAALAACGPVSAPAVPQASPTVEEAAPAVAPEVFGLAGAGLSFDLPPGARVEGEQTVQAGLPPVLTLYVPAEQFPDGNVITLVVSPYEKPEGQKLGAWATQYFSVGEAPVHVALTQALPSLAQRGEAPEALLVKIEAADESRVTVLLAHGKLVLDLSGPDTDRMGEYLPTLAGSIRFAAGAPTSLSELYGEPWAGPTLQQVYDERQAALETAPTGGEAGAADATPQGPEADAVPGEAPAGEVGAGDQVTVTSPLVPEAIGMAPPQAPTLAPSDREGYNRIQATSSYQGRFQCDYEASKWRLDGMVLRHRSLARCALDLGATGRGAAGPMVVEWRKLDDYEWRVTGLPAERLASFALDLPDAHYLFELEDASASIHTLDTPCRSAVFDVLASFQALAN